MKDDLRYTATDCFDTFAFPESFRTSDALEQIGRSYYDSRSELMEQLSLGVTSAYNRFHDPHEQSEGILELRRLHGLMDGAVLRAYGWDDLAESARCEFLLDYEEEEDDQPLGASPGSSRATSQPGLAPSGSGRGRSKKKPWRLRWPDEFRDEVLARLLELNEQRHKQELLTGGAKSSSKKGKPQKHEDTQEITKMKAAKMKAKPLDGQQGLGFSNDE